MKLYKLIIEGQQFVGKTTIANNLARRHLSGNPFLFKLSGPASGKNDVKFKEYMKHVLVDYANLFTHITNSSIICDRFHISEQVYGKFYRNYEHNKDIIESVENLLDELGFKIVFLTMDNKLISERIKLKEVEFNCKKTDLPPIKDQIEIKNLFEKYIKKSKLDVIRIDVTNKSILTTVQEIMKKLP